MDKFIFKYNKNEELGKPKNSPNTVLQNNETNNEVFNKQLSGDADDPNLT